MNKQKIIIDNRATESEALYKFLCDYINSRNIPHDILDDLRLAVEETFINIVSYAYPVEEIQKISIELSLSDNTIKITFTDTGRAFNPLSDCPPCDHTDEHCDGGMGIQLIKSLTDHQEYNRINNHNVFTVAKHYTKQNHKT